MFSNILLPVDIQEPDFSVPALETAAEHARRFGARLHAVAVLPGFSMPLVASYFPSDAMAKAKTAARDELQAFVARHLGTADTKVAVREGRPWEEIVEEARRVQADLIVIASHNRKGLEQVVLGSCAQRVAEHADCSVLIVRQRR